MQPAGRCCLWAHFFGNPDQDFHFTFINDDFFGSALRFLSRPKLGTPTTTQAWDRTILRIVKSWVMRKRRLPEVKISLPV
jgi:hypothetical protein